MSVIFVIALTLSVTSAHFMILNSKNNNESVANCVLMILDPKIYSKNTIVLYEPDNVHSTFFLFKEELVSLIFEKRLPYVVTNDLNQVYRMRDNYVNDFLLVIFHKPCDTFDILINKGMKYLVIVDEYILESNCNEIFMKTLSKVRIYDVTFVTRDKSNGKYDIITSIPSFDEKICDLDKKVAVRKINACVNGSLEINNRFLFPPKSINNLKMCKFKVGIATLFPYSVIENKESLDMLDSLKEQKMFGSDLEIMKIIAKHFNATLEMFYIKRNEENALLYTEYVEYLMNGTLDACAGGLYNIYGDVVAYSGIYTRQSIVWIYTVERETRSWQTLLRKTDGLYIFLIFQAFYSLTWKLLTLWDGQAVSLSNTVLYSLGALFGTTSLLDAKSLKQKILNMSYLILCLHLSSYVSTQMYYYLTVDNPPQTINTQDDLAMSDIVIYLVPTKKFFLNNEKYIAFANTSLDCQDFLDCERTVLKFRGATIILDGLLYTLQSATAVKDESRVMRVNEDILVIYHEMIMRKDSPMVDKFHNIVQRLFEAGICDKLYIEAIGVTVVDKANIAVKNILSHSYSCTSGCKITWSQLAGSFYLWIIGCGLAMCSFIVEVSMKNIKLNIF